MANQKIALYKVLVIALVFLCWFQSSGRVEAAEEKRMVWYEDYKYYSSGKLSYDRIRELCVITSNPKDLNYYFIWSDLSSTYRDLIIWSYNPVDVTVNYYEYDLLTDGSHKVYSDTNTEFTDGNYKEKYTLSDGRVIYIYLYRQVEIRTSNSSREVEGAYYGPQFQNSGYPYYNALKDILNNNIAPDIPYYGDYVPDWSTSKYDQYLKIENFQASIENDELYMTWDPAEFPEGEREFHYIKFRFKQRHPSAQESGNRRAYVAKEFYIQYKELCGRIPLSELELSDGYILSSIQATPYYHLSDNPEWRLYHGDTTYVYFDDDGISTNPIIIDPTVDPDVEEEDVPKTILGTIQNFFSNFFRNITNTAKAAVVPESEDLLGLLGEMNDWFSERFGFIWYPFDLAIDIVAAFGLGEPNTTITVPALTLNMMGGIQLWESFEINLDPVGFLQYVRFFTSVLMCCGTVSLAIRKWNEWIGGRNQ